LDATAQGVNKNFTVTPTYLDGRAIDPVPATYNSTTDRLEFQAPVDQEGAWWIYLLQNLVFNPAA
jgi:hypothetical protein